MTVLIVEDEHHAADRLKDMLLELDPSIEIQGMAPSVSKAVSHLRDHVPDLIFLDIQLSDGLCFDIFDHVAPKSPVIFTTAYDAYAIKAFKLNSIAYLLKPIKKDELASSLLKYHQMKRLFMPEMDSIAKEISGNHSYKKRFLVEIGQKIRTITVDEIAYFFAMEKAVYLNTHEGQRIPLDYTLDKLENLLDPAQFFRINRKFIISMNSIDTMSAYSRKRMKIILKPKFTGSLDTLVSLEKAHDFRAWLDQ